MKFVDFPRTGPRPNYCDADIYWMLRILCDRGRMGRAELSEVLEMGEGSIRSVIRKLREAGLISLFQTGTRINGSGIAFLNALPVIPADVNPGDIVLGECNQAVIVKNAADRISIGSEQRDAAIRAGGTGCTTVIYSDGKLMMPPDWNLDENSPDVASSIRSLDLMEENDVLIIGSAKNIHDARNASVTAALELI